MQINKVYNDNISGRDKHKKIVNNKESRVCVTNTCASEEQQVVTLRVCASRWTEVCGGIGSQRMQQRKMAPLLKITIVLVICSIFVECRSDKVFFVICEIGLKANKSQIIHNFTL